MNVIGVGIDKSIGRRPIRHVNGDGRRYLIQLRNALGQATEQRRQNDNSQPTEERMEHNRLA